MSDAVITPPLVEVVMEVKSERVRERDALLMWMRECDVQLMDVAENPLSVTLPDVALMRLVVREAGACSDAEVNVRFWSVTVDAAVSVRNGADVTET